MIDYSDYSFEDFLQDDYFVQSVRFPDSESTSFWGNYMESRPANLEDYKEASSFLEGLRREEEAKESISNAEKQELWRNIQGANEERRRIVRRKILYYGVGAAASLALLVLFALPFLTERHTGLQHESILSFVEANRGVSSDSASTTRLLLSENKEISLLEEESVITYDSSAIRAGNEKIAKKETSSYNQLIVPKGKRSLLTLSDGTKVWVNASTKVVYPVEFLPEKREIYVNGEIYLEVTHDQKRPFIVKTKDADVRVLGTSFNVAAYENEEGMSVVLASGAVKVVSRTTHKEAQLRPSEKYVYQQGVARVEQVDVYPYISWKDGVYVYDSESLDAIMLRLSRYYGTEIACDPAVAGQRCSGKLDLKDSIEQILQDIAYTVPISYTKQEDGRIWIEKKK